MNNNEYYNTLYEVFTNGKEIWDECSRQTGFVPKGKTQPYFKINGKLVSRKQLFDSKYIIKMLPKNRVVECDPILNLFDEINNLTLPIWAR